MEPARSRTFCRTSRQPYLQPQPGSNEKSMTDKQTPADAEARRVDELTALRKQDDALIRQLVQALESVDDAMPFPVAGQVLKVARARLEGTP